MKVKLLVGGLLLLVSGTVLAEHTPSHLESGKESARPVHAKHAGIDEHNWRRGDDSQGKGPDWRNGHPPRQAKANDNWRKGEDLLSKGPAWQSISPAERSQLRAEGNWRKGEDIRQAGPDWQQSAK